MHNPLLTSLQALTGQSDADLAQQSKLLSATVQQWPEVPDTKELRRILALPRRSLDSGEELARVFTAACRTPWGQWTLRPIQALALKEICEVGGAFCPINAGGGKAQPDMEPVLLARGWTPIGEVVVGDRIYGSDGRLHDVTGVFPQGERPVYKVSFSDGSEAYSDIDHLWAFDVPNNGKRNRQIRPLRDWLSEPLRRKAGPHGANRVFLPMCAPIERPELVLPLDPYTLGTLLGDGGSGLVGLSRTKAIPREYFRSSVAQRLALLQGLCDTDGTSHRSGAVFYSTSRQLATDVQELTESLGGTARITVKRGKYQGALHLSWRVGIKLPSGFVPFRCARKAYLYNAAAHQRGPIRAVVGFEPVGDLACTCISVSAPDSLYVTRHHVLTHNTLLSYLAPAFAQAARPALIVPAALRDKTRKEFRQLAQHFMGPHPDSIRILSYQELGRTTAGAEFNAAGQIIRPGLLEKLRPDLIVFDEVHKVKNDKAAVTRRVKRFLKANPGCKVVAMSGTVTKRSLKDYAHIARWCLPHTCPVPQTDDDLEAWAAALDEKVQAFQRLQPGALKLFVSGYFPDPDADPEGSLAAARQAYRSRLVETPGVVATQDGALGTSLVVSPWGDGGKCPKIEEAFKLLRDKWSTPDGQLFADPLTLARHARSLCLGVWYKWRVQPPEDWLIPRRAWASECRSLIKTNRRGLDSEKHIVQHLHLYPESRPLYDEWAAVKGTFEPETVPEWISDEALNWAVKWLEDGPGIIWTKHRFWGMELARRTGLSYYQQGGMNAQKQPIEDHPANKSLIASVDSNGTGRNLQKWSRNLLVSGLSNGEQMEQLIARTHRPGQEADSVDFSVYLGCAETLLGLNQARADARYTSDSIGQAQRLNYCDYLLPDAVNDGTARWSK